MVTTAVAVGTMKVAQLEPVCTRTIARRRRTAGLSGPNFAT
jgi:hypothetical protein